MTKIAAALPKHTCTSALLDAARILEEVAEGRARPTDSRYWRAKIAEYRKIANAAALDHGDA